MKHRFVFSIILFHHKKSPRYFLGIILFLLISFELSAQEKYGLSVSNFGGINAAHFNPTATVNSKIFLDVNLLSGGFSLANNFVFVHKEDFNLTHLLSSNPTFPSSEVRGEGFDYSTKYDLVNAFTRNDLTGPSVSVSLGNQSFGLFSRAMVVSSVRNMPVDLAVLLFEGIDYEPLHNDSIQGNNFGSAALSWYEVGFNYALIFSQNPFGSWSAGFNFRRLIGYSGAYLKAENADFSFLNDSTLEIRDMNANAGFSLPLDYNTNEFPGPDPMFKGRGIAMDFGLTYRRNRTPKYLPDPRHFCEFEYQPYLYKIGVSLLDVGNIKFGKNAQEHSYEDVSVLWENIDTTEFVSMNDFTRQLSTVFFGNPTASFVGANELKVGLSTAVNLQADFQYFPDWYLSGALILPVKLGDYQIERPGQVYLSLRYESDLVEVNLPVSLYDFEETRIGFYLRYSYFSMGTDKLGTLMGLNDQYGMDIYFSVKYHLAKGSCLSGKRYRDCKHLMF